MCDWESAGICALAAKVRWYEDDLKSLQQKPSKAGEISVVGEEGFCEGIWETEDMFLSIPTGC